MISLLYIGMYLHDCYVIETVIGTAIQRQLRYQLQEESIEEGTIDWDYWEEKTLIWSLTASLDKEKELLKQYIEQSLQKKLLIAEQPMIDIELQVERIVVSYESDVNRFNPIIGCVALESIEIQEQIRMYRGLLGGIKDGT